MKLEKEIEEKIKEAVLNKIGDGGRPDWDIPHTLCAVKWMKKLIDETGADERVLVPAIYFHDTGYPNLRRNYSYEEVMFAKKMHAKRGAEFSRNVLETTSGFSEVEMREICRLVENHDVHSNILDNDLNRQLIFEADGLAQLDWENCPPNFDKENCLKWIKEYFEVERPLKYWRTGLGKRKIQEMRKKADIYWENK